MLRTQLLFCLSLLASPAWAEGPFGIEMGSPMSALDSAETSFKVTLNSVPKPHPDFEMYSAWGTPEHGVCVVMALLKTFENDRRGTLVRTAFTGFAGALDAKYGNRSTYDVYSGGIWKEADDWVMSIRQNERVFAAAWENPQKGDPKVEHVELQVIAVSSDTAVLKLFYKGTDSEKCIQAIDGAKNDSF